MKGNSTKLEEMTGKTYQQPDASETEQCRSKYGNQANMKKRIDKEHGKRIRRSLRRSESENTYWSIRNNAKKYIKLENAQL